jgi:hypothetical protein
MLKIRSARLKSIVFVVIIAIAFLNSQVWAAVAELSWDANTAPELTGYRVHYGTTSGSYQNVVDAGTATTLEIDGLKPGQTYYFAVPAWFNSYETEYSDEVSISVPANATDSDSGGGGGGGGCFIQTAKLA